MSAIILGIYALIGVIHEVSAVLFREGIRKFTKAALMPVLLVFYIVTSSNLQIMAIVAIVFSWLGDIFLIRKDEPKFFRLGLVAFLLSHVFYIIALLFIIDSYHFSILLISIVVALIAEILLPKIIKPPKAMFIPVIVYGIVILAMCVFAMQYMLSIITPASILLFVGSIVFVFSDTLMTYLAFREKPKYFNAITMLPYIIAQALIVFGLASH